MSIKIPAGMPVVIHAVPEAALENAARHRANGTVFVPPWRIWVYGPVSKLPRGAMQVFPLHDEPAKAVAVYGAFTFKGTDLVPAYTVDKFPHPWAPRVLQAVTAWLETTKGLTAYESQTEEFSDNG